MLQETIRLISENKKARLGAVLILAIVLLVVIIGLFAFRKPESPYVLTDTDLTRQRSFATFIGDRIVAYNGAVFYAIDTKNNNQLHILSNPGKLPVPSDVFYADDKGALLQFKESFTSTRIEEALRARGDTLNETTKLYTWYLDFNTGNLELVHQGPIVAGMASYNTRSANFYFVPEDLSTIEFTQDNPLLITSRHELRRYTPGQSGSQLVVEDLRIQSIETIVPCTAQASEVCLITRSDDNPRELRVMGVTGEGVVKTLLTSSGRLEATNRPDIFITTNNEQTETIQDKDIEEAVDYAEADVVLRNTTTGAAIRLNLMIANEDVATYVTDRGFYLLSAAPSTTGGNESKYWVGTFTGDSARTYEYPFMFKDRQTYQQSLVGTSGYGAGEKTLITGVDGVLRIFAPTDSVRAIERKSVAETERQVRDCAGPTGIASTQFFPDESTAKLFINDNANISATASAFNRCLIDQDDALLIGYWYYFGTQDPISGRITSD